jgi:hypothetical protein
MSAENYSKENSSKQPLTYIPAAALKRFADELSTGDAHSNKFLQINRERVHHFIEKPNRPANSKGLESPNKRTVIPGVYSYDFSKQSPSTFVHLQRLPEFQPVLGARSRFGEGDGSFFDRWLNSDVISSKHLFDKDGFPIMR